MDIERSDFAAQRSKRRVRYTAIASIAGALLVLGLTQLKPALPTAERKDLWIDQVKRGTLLRQIRGVGVLAPVEVNWLSAVTEARVEKIAVQPGTVVRADSIILQLSDSGQVQRELDARFQLIAAEADFATLKNRLESDYLDQQAAAAKLKADAEQARLRADADEEMARQKVLPELTRKMSRNAADQMTNRYTVELDRLRINRQSIQTQMEAQKAKVDALRAQYDLQRNRLDALHVRAGIDGVLQQVSVEVGQRVTPGTILAKVVQPDRLKAAVKIAETQARELQLGQSAIIDIRSGTVAGHIVRIDPAAQNGTVTVDIAPDAPLPKGTRPDLSVDATIELQRLTNVLYVGKPLHAEEDEQGTVFRVDGDEKSAQRVPVKFGRSSTNTIEIVDGLKEGDRIVLSDTSRWDGHDRIRVE